MLVFVCSIASADRVHERITWTDAAIAEITKSCGRSGSGGSTSWWCRARGWDHGSAALLPRDRPLIGRWLGKGQAGLHVRSIHTLEARDELVGLVVTGPADHPKIRLEILDDVEPSVRADLTDVLEGRATRLTRVTLPAAIARNLRALAGTQPVIAVDDEWYWDDRSDDLRLRFVDGVWVAILSPPPAAARAYPDAREIYVFTDAWQ